MAEPTRRAVLFYVYFNRTLFSGPWLPEGELLKLRSAWSWGNMPRQWLVWTHTALSEFVNDLCLKFCWSYCNGVSESIQGVRQRARGDSVDPRRKRWTESHCDRNRTAEQTRQRRNDCGDQRAQGKAPFYLVNLLGWLFHLLCSTFRRQTKRKWSQLGSRKSLYSHG